MSAKTLSRLALGTLALVALVATPNAWALGTPAGTDITNQATVDFEDVNGNPLQVLSNVVTTTVSAVASVDIDPAALSSNADPGDLVCYAHTLTNNGNDDDTIEVVTTSSQGWTVTVYEDLDSDGVLDAGEPALTNTNGANGVDTDVMAADATMEILVCVSVPAGAANNTVDTTDIDIASAADPGQTDSATDTTTIDAPDLSVVKSVAPVGDQPPGTTLTYTIVITNNGDADAVSVVLTDPIPANTTYVAASASTTVGSITLEDPVTADIGTLASGATATVTFQVTID